MQKLPFIEHFSITCCSGINEFAETVWVFSFNEFGKTILDEDLVCGNFNPLVGCILLLLIVFSFFGKDFVTFEDDNVLTLVFFVLLRGSILKILVQTIINKPKIYKITIILFKFKNFL